MSRKHWLAAGTALALGVVWTAGPALAQQTTGEKIDNKVERAKDKAEHAKDKAEVKAEHAKDKAEAKAEQAKDKAEDKAQRTKAKAERAKDKAEAKADRASDKAESKTDQAKDKAREMKDKVKDKTSELTHKAKDKTAALGHKMDRAHDRNDVIAMQQALRDKGYDPGPIDGVNGPRTHAALVDYQKKEGLMPTGTWDDETRARLGVHTAAAPDQTAVSASPADPRGEKVSVGNPPPTKRQSP